MVADLEEIIRLAQKELVKLVPNTPFEVEEVEERGEPGHAGNCLITFSYWARDKKPSPQTSEFGPSGTKVVQLGGPRTAPLAADLLNPWRKRFKRVEVDTRQNKVIAIRMYEPPLGVL